MPHSNFVYVLNLFIFKIPSNFLPSQPASSIHEKELFMVLLHSWMGQSRYMGLLAHIIHYLVSVPYLLSLYVCLFFSFLPHHDHSSCCFFWYSHFPQLQFFSKVIYPKLYKHWLYFLPNTFKCMGVAFLGFIKYT